jgi:hypothetical protein
MQQVKAEEKQRLLGVIPNFYVAYGVNTQPLTTKLKFQLAFKTITDPATIGGAAFLGGLYQAADTPDYQQGLKGYGQRFGAVYANGASDILVGGAILPSLLHQDPRYFYQGTGSNTSRAFHAISAPFCCERRQRSLAVQLFEHRRRSCFWRSCESLLPRLKSWPRYGLQWCISRDRCPRCKCSGARISIP